MDSRRVARWTRLAAAVLTLCGGSAVAAEPSIDEIADETIQFLADLTVIDGDCHDLSVNFGIGLQFASGRGFAVTSVMPSGAKRSIFDRDRRATQASFDPETICGGLAHHYSVMVPGSVTFPYEARDHGT